MCNTHDADIATLLHFHFFFLNLTKHLMERVQFETRTDFQIILVMITECPDTYMSICSFNY